MLNKVKDVMHSIGDGSGTLARRVGGASVGAAKRIGNGTTSVARRIGTKRAVIGAAIIGVSVAGTILLVRYLRGRKAITLGDVMAAGDATMANPSRPNGVSASPLVSP